ncbi:hypothetical protein RDI58_027012 [Solanum bulbocastanum]|uniref:Uncharacterized protein n=1 Tax=Solanum bulbocastanum TaxID=147425 RepID=A0AAN8T015_SOLBU
MSRGDEETNLSYIQTCQPGGPCFNIALLFVDVDARNFQIINRRICGRVFGYPVAFCIHKTTNEKSSCTDHSCSSYLLLELNSWQLLRLLEVQLPGLILEVCGRANLSACEDNCYSTLVAAYYNFLRTAKTCWTTYIWSSCYARFMFDAAEPCVSSRKASFLCSFLGGWFYIISLNIKMLQLLLQQPVNSMPVLFLFLLAFGILLVPTSIAGSGLSCCTLLHGTGRQFWSRVC